MCGRYTLTVEQEALQAALGVEGLIHPRPRFNLAPSQAAPGMIWRDDGPAPALLRWGLIPFWARQDSSARRPLVNARAESVHLKPSFRDAFRRRRCLIPADGFYEWRSDPGGKQPFWIHRRDRGVFTFAALWEEAGGGPGGAADPSADPRRVADPQRTGGEEPLGTFAILTTDASAELRRLHHRMPVVVRPQDRTGWLDPRRPWEQVRGWLSELSGLADGDGNHWNWIQVSRRVNSPAHDDPACLEPPSVERADDGPP